MPHYLETGKGLACYQGKNFRWEGGGEKRKEEEARKGEGGRWREVREDGRGEKEGLGRRKEWEEKGGEKEVKVRWGGDEEEWGVEGCGGRGEYLPTLQTVIFGL